MGRTIRAAVSAFALISLTHTVAADRAAACPHIRSNQPELLEAVAAASRVSPTFRQLVERLSASDVVVYLGYRIPSDRSIVGATSFLTAAGGLRYVRVAAGPGLSGCERVSLLGHELQHAVEIADADSVVDQQSLEELYRAVGFLSSAACPRCFESAAAIAVGRRIKQEAIVGEMSIV